MINWQHIIWCCAVSCLWYAAHAGSHHTNSSHHIGLPFLGSYQQSLYLVHRGKAQKLPPNNVETIVNLRLDPQSAKEIPPHVFNTLSHGEDIPIIEYNKKDDADEIFRVLCLVNKVLQGRLIKDVVLIGRYINPSIVPLKGRFLMATGLAWQVNGVNEGKQATEHIEFRWMNHTRFPFSSTESFCGVGVNINPLSSGGILGQDPRMVAVGDDKIVMVYTNRFEPRPRMGAAELTINPQTGVLEATKVLKTLFFNTKSPEKNWSPFLVGTQDVYLIQSINPMRIMGFVQVGHEEHGAAIIASEAPQAFHPFKYGHLRGGSNAIDLGDRYLAIFHSTTVLPNNYLTTYFMGAFTFTKTSPWRLLTISPEPILDDWMYQGPYAPFKNRQMDYVIFPNSLNRLNEHEILIGFGYQDDRGFAATVNLKELLDSMVPVVYCDDRPEKHHPEIWAQYCSSGTQASETGARLRHNNKRK